jgi:hypothetical protein
MAQRERKWSDSSFEKRLGLYKLYRMAETYFQGLADDMKPAIEREFERRGIDEYHGTTVNATSKVTPGKTYNLFRLARRFGWKRLVNKGAVRAVVKNMREATGLTSRELEVYQEEGDGDTRPLVVTPLPHVEEKYLTALRGVADKLGEK